MNFISRIGRFLLSINPLTPGALPSSGCYKVIASSLRLPSTCTCKYSVPSVTFDSSLFLESVMAHCLTRNNYRNEANFSRRPKVHPVQTLEQNVNGRQHRFLKYMRCLMWIIYNCCSLVMHIKVQRLKPWKETRAVKTVITAVI